MHEYAIWGKDATHNEDTLLCAMPQGNPITTLKEADSIATLLQEKYGCYDVRIQFIGDIAPDFAKTINI